MLTQTNPTFNTLQANNESVVTHFETIVVQKPQQIAVSGNGKTLTYEQLNQWANQLAHVIAATKTTSQPIVLLLAHDIPICAAIWGVLKSGNFYISLAPKHPVSQHVEVIAILQAKIIVTQTQFLPLAQQLENNMVSVINIEALDPQLPNHNLDLAIANTQPAGVFFTSGTTGKPKGVIRSHRAILHRILTEETHTKNIKQNTLLKRSSMLQPCHLANSVHDLFSTFLAGHTLCFFNIYDTGIQGFATWLKKECISYLHIPGALFRQFLADLAPNDYFPDMQMILPTGRQFKQDIEKIWQHFPVETMVFSRYSSSETGQVTRMLITRDTLIEGDIVPIGYVMPGYEVSLIDNNGQPVPNGTSGEIVVHSTALFDGYWGQPQLTSAVLSQNNTSATMRTYRTGDWGRLRPDGCLEFLGRKDDRVKIRGFTVELAEVEAAAASMTQVKAVAVIAKDIGMGDKKLLCYWVATNEATLTNSELRQQLAQRLPDHMLPAAFMQLAALPIANTGKLDRAALPDIGRNRPPLSTPYTPARSTDEAQLIEIWAEVLNIDNIGVHDSFADLGGNSLQAMRIVSRVARDFKVNISLGVLLQKASIAEMALSISQTIAEQFDSDRLQQLLDELERSI